MNTRTPFFSWLRLGLMGIALLAGALPVAGDAPRTAALYAGWEEVAGSATLGGISQSTLISNAPSLAFDQEGRAVVAWNGDDSGGGSEIYLKRLEGSQWVGIGGSASGGGISNSASFSGHVALAIGPDGQPAVAWSESVSNGNSEITVKQWNGSAWVGLDGTQANANISGTPGESDYPALAFDHDGRPVVAWAENIAGTNSEIYVKRWNGSAWVGPGGSATGGGTSATPGDSRVPSLAIDSEGHPLVAWDERNSGSDDGIYVKRWNGSAWEALINSADNGEISQNVGASYNPSLTISASGEIVVAWEDNSGPGDGYDIYAKRWTGLTWVPIGGSASGQGISDDDDDSIHPSLMTTLDGKWIVAWENGSEGGTVASIFFRLWNGSSWQELETGSATSGQGISGISEDIRSIWPSLAVAPDGMLMVAWEFLGPANADIYARRYQIQTYGGWQALGNSADGGDISRNSGLSVAPSLALDTEGAPFVAWQDGSQPGSGDIFVKVWKDAYWQEIGGSATLGGISNTPGDSAQPSLAIDAGGRPIVAWRESTASDQEIYLRRWNGSLWGELGGSATGGGLSNTPGGSDHPWLVIDPAGRPVVAWVETTTNREIYLARWDGASWAALGGSASGGLSNSPGDSFRPSVAIDTAGNPVVAWSDVNINSGNSEIYIKRWNGSAWVEMGVGSASGGGVSATPGGSFRPSLVINAAGVAAVAWEDDSGGDYEIYARGYDPATDSWKSIGSGSAEGGGLSNNAGGSTWPSLTIAADGRPAIAWQDDSNGRPQVYFRRFDGAAWIETGPQSARAGGVSGASVAAQAHQPSLAVTGGRWVAVWANVLGDEEADIYGRTYERCFPLTLGHSGQGLAPLADPANSPGCAAGEYKAGALISLTAEPAAGWHVADWSGTANNGSNETTNWLTMPASDHAAAVRYITDQYLLYLPVIVRWQGEAGWVFSNYVTVY